MTKMLREYKEFDDFTDVDNTRRPCQSAGL